MELTRTERVSVKSVAVALAPVALLGALCVFDIPICPSRVLFGVPCPGCGLTRATRALATLDLSVAFAMHPLVFVLAPLVGYVLGRNTLVAAGVIARDNDPIDRVPRVVWTVLVIAITLVWVARIATGTHPDGVTFCSALVARTLGLCAP